MMSSVVKLGSNGRFVIPAEHRKALGLSEGELLLVRAVDGELRICTTSAAVARAKELVRRHVPEGHSLADELLRERRAESERD
jgi:AbrB family looped-hinge helix DNA binding protein